jgi:hypothetical protein
MVTWSVVELKLPVTPDILKEHWLLETVPLDPGVAEVKNVPLSLSKKESASLDSTEED